MSTGPWQQHAAHCPRCGHYGLMQRRYKKGRRYRCANDECRRMFWKT